MLSSGIGLTSWGETASLALVGQPSGDDVTVDWGRNLLVDVKIVLAIEAGLQNLFVCRHLNGPPLEVPTQNILFDL